jgi:hypothetical protein
MSLDSSGLYLLYSLWGLLEMPVKPRAPIVSLDFASFVNNQFNHDNNICCSIHTQTIN